MYHCHIHFYLAGCPCNVFDLIKKISPLEHFTHEFSEGAIPESELISQADVIIFHLQGEDCGEAVRKFIHEKKAETELILLADKRQILSLEEYMEEVGDIWTMPMSDAEIRFRFLGWQRNCKRNTDYWQTNQFFESTINNIPNLIWYKDPGRFADYQCQQSGA